MGAEGKPDRRPANQRGAARLAAVQALYQMDLGGTTLTEVLGEFESYRLGKEIDGTQYRDADAAFFRDIVAGVVRDQRQLDPAIHSALTSDWPLARLDATLRAILRSGAYELASRPDVPARVVITEYVDVAKAFFEKDVPAMVNAVLDALGPLAPSGGIPDFRQPILMATPSGKRPGEFALIERYFRPLATDPAAYGLRDDAAELSPPIGEDLVLTTDLIAEGVHFFKDDPPRAIAQKALRVNLSDLAAKGAAPLGYLMAIALPRDWTEGWVAAFADGLAEDQERYAISLLGGDTSRSSDGLNISITAIGRLPKGTMIHRSGARPGDEVFVSGTIGDAALGLRIRLGTLDARAAGDDGARHLLERYLVPEPRLSLAPVIRQYANSALDISDGLVGDFQHICATSGVGGQLEAGRVPLSAGASAVVAADATALATVLTGGDDYEVLATVSADRAARFVAAAQSKGVQVTRIGRVAGAEDGLIVRDADGRPLALERLSHTHF